MVNKPSFGVGPTIERYLAHDELRASTIRAIVFEEQEMFRRGAFDTNNRFDENAEITISSLPYLSLLINISVDLYMFQYGLLQL